MSRCITTLTQRTVWSFKAWYQLQHLQLAEFQVPPLGVQEKVLDLEGMPIPTGDLWYTTGWACSANNSSLKLAFARHLSDSWSYKEASWSQARCESLGRSKVKTRWKSSIGYIGCPQHLAPLAPGPEQATLHCISQVSLSLCCLFYRWKILFWPLCGDMIDFSWSNRHACASFLRCNGMHRWKHQNPGYRSILVIFVGFPVLTIPLAVQVSSQWVHRHPMFQQGQDAGLCGKHRGSGWPDARDRGGASAGLWWLRYTDSKPASRSIFGIAIQKVPQRSKTKMQLRGACLDEWSPVWPQSSW